MRGKVAHNRTEIEDHYDYKSLSNNATKRLDLNDLLKRAADEKSRNKKINLLIFSGATFIVLMFLFLLSFW